MLPKQMEAVLGRPGGSGGGVAALSHSKLTSGTWFFWVQGFCPDLFR